MWPNDTLFCSNCNSSAWCIAWLYFVSSLLLFPVSSVFGTEGTYAHRAYVLNVRAPFTRLAAQIFCNSNFLCYENRDIPSCLEAIRCTEASVLLIPHFWWFCFQVQQVQTVQQVQHVYPAQVQYVEGSDTVYTNGAM